MFAECMNGKWKIHAQHEFTLKFYISAFPEGQKCITQPWTFTTRNFTIPQFCFTNFSQPSRLLISVAVEL